MSNEYLEWLSIHQLPKLRTLVLQQNLSRDDLVDFLTKHNQKVYKTELTEDLLQRINRNFVFDYVQTKLKEKPKESKEDTDCVYDENGKKTKTVTDMFGHKWTVKDAIKQGLLIEVKTNNEKKCVVCQTMKKMDQFSTRGHDNVGNYYHVDFCSGCEGKARCQLCNEVRNSDRFYTKKAFRCTIPNTKKCKDCYIKDHEVRKYKESKNEYLF